MRDVHGWPRNSAPVSDSCPAPINSATSQTLGGLSPRHANGSPCLEMATCFSTSPNGLRPQTLHPDPLTCVAFCVPTTSLTNIWQPDGRRYFHLERPGSWILLPPTSPSLRRSAFAGWLADGGTPSNPA